MMIRVQLPWIATCLTLAVLASSTRAQTFDIEELPVLSEKEHQFSTGLFINERGHVLGDQSGEGQFDGMSAFLWNGSRAINFETRSSDLNDLDQIILADRFSGTGVFWDGRSTFELDVVPLALNNLGQVAGETSDGLALWTAETGTRALGKLPDAFATRFRDLNERGHVAGIALDLSFALRVIFWSEETGIKDLGPASNVAAMNDQDQILGHENGVPFRISVTITPEGEAVTHRVHLPTPDPALTRVDDINNAGQAVGMVAQRYVFWNSDGELIVNEETRFGGSFPIMNDSGHVVFQGLSGDFLPRAFFWNPLDLAGGPDGTTIQLPTLVGHSSLPASISEFDEITGHSQVETHLRAVLWRPTGPIPEGSAEILLLKELVRGILGEGRIDEGDATSLLGKLCAADNQLRNGNTNAAIGVLGSAQNQIDQLIRNGFIDTQTGEELIETIDAIILLL